MEDHPEDLQSATAYVNKVLPSSVFFLARKMRKKALMTIMMPRIIIGTLEHLNSSKQL
jgi:hypothetical protein